LYIHLEIKPALFLSWVYKPKNFQYVRCSIYYIISNFDFFFH